MTGGGGGAGLPFPGKEKTVIYETELDSIREKLYAFCFPNVPEDLQQQEMFDRAACMQYAWEQQQAQTMGTVPQGLKSIRLGDFSAELAADQAGGALTQKNMCPEAYGLLLRSGLLYRGVEGRCRC